MTISTIVNNLIANVICDNNHIDGDLHYFVTNDSKQYFYSKDEVPDGYVSLNIRSTLKKLYPNMYPDMIPLGFAIKQKLIDLGITHFWTLENRWWEFSNAWAQLEIVYIKPEDYEKHILARINQVVEQNL